MACKTTCKKEEGKTAPPLEPSTNQKNDVQTVLHLPLLTALLKRNE